MPEGKILRGRNVDRDFVKNIDAANSLRPNKITKKWPQSNYGI